MVTHLKLTGGQFRHVEDENIVVENISGKLIAICHEEGKICFVFQSGEEDFIRLYLDLDHRPSTRLFWLITNKLQGVAQYPVLIESVGEPGYSRLQLKVLDENGTQAECPHYLPFETIRDRRVFNSSALSQIASVLGFTVEEEEPAQDGEQNADDGGEQEETDERPVIIDGLSNIPPGEDLVTARDARRLTLVRSFTALVFITPSVIENISKESVLEFIRNNDRDAYRIKTLSFHSSKERSAYGRGLSLAAEVGDFSHMMFTSAEDIAEAILVQAHPDRDIEY